VNTAGAHRVSEATQADGGTIRDFRRRLEAIEYATLQRLHGASPFGRDRASAVRETLREIPLESRLALRMLYFGEAIEAADAATAFGAALVDGLCCLGVFEHRADGRVVARYRMEVAGRTLVLTNTLLGRPLGVYFGEDSQFLHAMLEPRPGDLCLDLCTGSGIQGIECAAASPHVDLVDINPAAVCAARLNAQLNGVGDRVTVHLGDLWDALPAHRTYDYVTCNPPLVPVADGIPYPICGDGGPDGLRLLRRILSQLESRLRPGGRCTMIGASTGDASNAAVESAIREFLEGANFCATLYLLFRRPLLEWVRDTAASAAAIYPGFNAQECMVRAHATYGVSLDRSYVYTYLLKMRRERRSRHIVVPSWRSNRRSYWFVGCNPSPA
jgi:methylase of polypeptide subunit release factors